MLSSVQITVIKMQSRSKR